MQITASYSFGLQEITAVVSLAVGLPLVKRCTEECVRMENESLCGVSAEAKSPPSVILPFQKCGIDAHSGVLLCLQEE